MHTTWYLRRFSSHGDAGQARIYCQRITEYK